LGGLALLLSVGLARAQDPASISIAELETEGRKHRDIWQKLYKAEVAANASDKSHMEAIDFQARYDTYRFAHQRFHKVGGSDPRETIDRLYKDFDGDVDAIIRSKNKVLAQLFTQKTIEHGKKVLESPNSVPLVQINIARVFARLAGLGQPELADALVGILKDAPKVGDKENDGVKYWALRGLRDLLARGPNPAQLLTPDREDKVAAALVAFIQRKVTITSITPKDEEEGLRVLRREAVRALAQIHTPGKAGKDRPALVLLRVMANEGFKPEPRFDERMEAAIGLARMRPDKDKDYQPAYAAQQIALFLKDFAEEYSRTNGSKELKEERRPTRVLAAQLLDALEALKTETKDDYVKTIFDTGKLGNRLLERIVAEQTADPSPLVAEVEKNPPKDLLLFKNMPDSTVTPPKK